MLNPNLHLKMNKKKRSFSSYNAAYLLNSVFETLEKNSQKGLAIYVLQSNRKEN